jgi:hypothetical protein
MLSFVFIGILTCDTFSAAPSIIKDNLINAIFDSSQAFWVDNLAISKTDQGHWNSAFIRFSLTTEGATEKVSQFKMPRKSV